MTFHNNEITTDDKFYYPENLTEKTLFIGWTAPNAAILGIGVLISIAALAYLGVFIPLLITVIYAVLSFTVAGTSMYEQLVIVVRYLFTDTLVYIWDSDKEGDTYGEKG